MWVLVIDDAVSNTIFITETLKALEHRGVASHDPVAALALLDQMAFDCILVDYHMPSINGSAFLTSLQAKLAHTATAIPVVVMTADPSPDLVEEVTGLGAVTVLHKPLGAGILEATLNRLRTGLTAPLGTQSSHDTSSAHPPIR